MDKNEKGKDEDKKTKRSKDEKGSDKESNKENEEGSENISPKDSDKKDEGGSAIKANDNESNMGDSKISNKTSGKKKLIADNISVASNRSQRKPILIQEDGSMDNKVEQIVEDAKKEGTVVAVENVSDHPEEENFNQADELIKDIMAEEKKQAEIVEETRDRKFGKKTLIKKVPFSFGTIDTYMHARFSYINEIVRNCIECLVFIIIIMVWPSILIIWNRSTFVGSLIQAIFDLKHTDNVLMFFRENLFVSIAYSTHVMMSIFITHLLYVSTIVLQVFDVHIKGFVAEFLHVLRASQNHLKNTIVAFIMFWVGGRLLEEYKMFSKQRNLTHLIMTAILWLGILSSILFVESIMMNLLTTELRRKGFKTRIWDTNYKTFIIKKLAAVAEAMPYGKHRVNEIIRTLINDYDTGFFLRHNELNLSSVEAANETAEGIFGYLEIEEITHKDLKTYFPDNYDEVYCYLSGKKLNKEDPNFSPIEFEDFNKRVLELYQERIDISRSIYDRDNILRKLDYILLSIVSGFSLLIYLLLLDVDYKLYLASIGPLFFGVGWIFQDSIKEIYRCFVFLLVNHPFDCGDRIKVDNEELVILRVDLLYTTCNTVNGKVKYLPNAALFMKNIENIRRSDIQAEDVFITVTSATTFVQMLKVRDQLDEFLKRNEKEFTGVIYIKNYENAGANMKVIFTVEHSFNFQELKPQIARRDIFIKELEKIMSQNSIQFEKCYTTSD